jgi:hypothetical protein
MNKTCKLQECIANPSWQFVTIRGSRPDHRAVKPVSLGKCMQAAERWLSWSPSTDDEKSDNCTIQQLTFCGGVDLFWDFAVLWTLRWLDTFGRILSVSRDIYIA